MNEPPFVIAYQPIVNVQTRSIVAYEALTRGMDGRSYPELTAAMDIAALRRFHKVTSDTALRRAVELGILDLGAALTVNLQPDLHPEALDAKTLAESARRHGMPAGQILVEFTEDHKLSVEDYQRMLARNQDVGFATGMDDFGSGYSGLTALVECRPEVLKLDRALVRGIDTSDARQKIVQAFANCSRALGMELVAEGIETEPECMMLRELGIVHMQGYLFSRPVLDSLPVETVWGIDRVEAREKHRVRPSLLHSLRQTLGQDPRMNGLSTATA